MRDYVQLHLVILAWGFTAILGKLITLPPLDVTVWRTGLAAAGFAVVALTTGRSLRVTRGEALKLLGTGCIIGWHWVLFFLAARLSTASVCLAALPTCMLWCSLIEPWINGRRRWHMGELLAGTVMVGAVWLIYQVELRYWLGLTVGLVSALLAALFAVINKQLTHRHSFTTLCFYQMAGAFAACVVTLPFFSHRLLAVLPAGADIGWLLVLSLVCTVAAYAGYVDVLRRMSVFTVNVVYNLEPVYGIVLAALVFGDTEKMSGGFYAGALIIIGAVLLMPLVSRPEPAS